MGSDRFANILGKEYNLFKKAVPHHDEFQTKIGEVIKNYSNNLSGDILVIDGGCGTGITTTKILEANSRIKVIGIDNEEKTIAQAREILKDYDDRARIQKEDLLEALKKLADESVNIYVSVWVIHNLDPNYRSMLFTEIARILKKGGLFINGDKYARNEPNAHRHDLNAQIKAFDIFDKINRPDLKKEWTNHYLQDEKIKITETEQIKILEKLGFKDILVWYRQGMEAIITAIR